jgi:hypothetical protein
MRPGIGRRCQSAIGRIGENFLEFAALLGCHLVEQPDSLGANRPDAVRDIREYARTTAANQSVASVCREQA